MILTCYIWLTCLVIHVVAVVYALEGDGVAKEGNWLLERVQPTSSESCTTHCLKHKVACTQLLMENGTCSIMGSKLNMLSFLMLTSSVSIRICVILL